MCKLKLILYIYTFNLQLKYFEPVWGDSKLSNSNTPLASNWSNSKHKKTETITAPVATPPVTTEAINNATAMCSLLPHVTTEVKTNALPTSSLSDDNKSEKVKNEDIKNEDIKNDEIKNEDINNEGIKNEDIVIEDVQSDMQLVLPWDSVDSTTDTMVMDAEIEPLIEDVILSKVNNFVFIFLLLLITTLLFNTGHK